jgi:hypothetical protein
VGGVRGGLIVETAPRKRGRVPEYACYRQRSQGTCTNGYRMAVLELNEAVLQAVEAHALTPEAIATVINLAAREDTADLKLTLVREQADNRQRRDRLADAIAGASDLTTLVGKLRDLEARAKAIDQELKALRPVPRLARRSWTTG